MDIVVLLLKTNTKETINRSIVIENKEYFPSLESIQSEIKSYSLNAEVINCSEKDIPRRIDANLILFLSDKLYVQDDFLNTCISLNNIFRSAGLFCGPVYTNIDLITTNDDILKYSKSYYQYELDFGGSEVCNITGEDFNYPSLLGCAVTGRAYNEIGYSPIISSRHSTLDNRCFISNLSRKYEIYYANPLSKTINLNKQDFSLDALSNYYYELGYQDGLLLLNKSIKDKRKELWHRFVESPEIFDNEMPRWLFESSPEEDGEYLENLVLMKCKYQIGFYEGMLGKKLI